MSVAETGIAFLEGAALIASPCILPVLPLVLSASVDGGRKRPFGIIIGFVLSFTLFALASRKLVTIFHVDPGTIRSVSLVLLAAFGLTLLSSQLSAKFSEMTQGIASLGARIGTSGKEGWISGILIGTLIGLVWTPCAGPILAAVLVQVIRQQTDFAGFVLIISFAFGAGLPMLGIALAERKIMGKLGFLTAHTETLRKAVGVIILGSVAYIASGPSIEMPAAYSSMLPPHEAVALEDGVDTPYAAPDFASGSPWINSKPLTMGALKGKVVLVDFWTYSCINCIRTLPYITQWDAKYRDKGLVIVGVHAPEFEFEKNADNVKSAVAQYGIHYPVVLDNDLATWGNFNNRYWPAHYLIDRTGKVVYVHFGEGKYDVTENNIRYLLGITDKVQNAPTAQTGDDLTPETYFGSARRARFSGDTFPASLKLHSWALEGEWKTESEKIVSTQAGAALRLHFKATKVFMVLGTATGKPITITVTSGNMPAKTFTVASDKLYELIDQPSFKERTLEITAGAAGLEAYTFTFGK